MFVYSILRQNNFLCRSGTLVLWRFNFHASALILSPEKELSNMDYGCFPMLHCFSISWELKCWLPLFFKICMSHPMTTLDKGACPSGNGLGKNKLDQKNPGHDHEEAAQPRR